MEEYRYIVCDYSMEDAIPSQEFKFLQDALSYAKTGNQTLIWKRKLVDGEWKDEEDEIVWSIDDEKDWPDPEPLSAFPLDEELSWPHPDQAESMPLNEELQVFSKGGKAVAAWGDAESVEQLLAALLGEDHDYFDCDSPMYDKPCSKTSDTFNPDFEQDFDEDEPCVDGEDSYEADSPECDGEGCGKPEEKAVLAEPEDEEPAGEAPQMDMIDGKLVPAKDPEKAEIEIDIEEEEDDRLNESVSDRREMCSDLYKEICDGQARGEKPSKEKIDEFGKCLGKFKQAMDAERITDAKDEKAYKRLSAAFSELNGALAESGSDDISDEEFLEEFGKKVASRKSKDEKPLKEEADWDSMSEEEFLKAFGKKIKADIAAGKLGKKNA